MLGVCGVAERIKQEHQIDVHLYSLLFTIIREICVIVSHVENRTVNCLPK